MHPTMFLRVAAVVSLLFCIGHTSGIPWTLGEGAADAAVVDAMKLHHFDLAGTQRSYWDIYFGFGVMNSVYLLLQAVMLWEIGRLARKGTPVRVMIAAVLVAAVFNLIIVYNYFFNVPIVMSAVIIVCLVLAFILSGISAASRKEADRKEADSSQ